MTGCSPDAGGIAAMGEGEGLWIPDLLAGVPEHAASSCS